MESEGKRGMIREREGEREENEKRTKTQMLDLKHVRYMYTHVL